MSSNQTITLAQGGAQLELRPAYGGRITRLTSGDWDILRPIPNEEKDVFNGYKGGSFPLVPFSNRIKGASFRFEGREITLAPHPNEPGNAMHGHGCFSEWSAGKITDSSALISYDHETGHMGWPWSYRASQLFELTSSECRVTITITNTSDTRMPAGVGFHPFFAFDDDVNLRFTANSEWIGGPEGFPTKRREVQHAFANSGGALLWNEEKTVCYDGFKGDAKIEWQDDHRLHLTASDPLNHFIVHVPAAKNYFCLEPVNHPTDGFNLAARGVDGVEVNVLEPGQSTSATMALNWG